MNGVVQFKYSRKKKPTHNPIFSTTSTQIAFRRDAIKIKAPAKQRSAWGGKIPASEF